MSSTKRVAIFQATSNINGHLMKRLLASSADITIKAAARSPAKLTIEDKRVSKVKLDIFDQKSVAEALKGSQALFIVAPTAYGGRDHSEAVIEWSEILRNALKENKEVERLVLLSSFGANESTTGPPIKALGDAERVLSSSTKEVIFLRAPAFLENWKESFPYAQQPPYKFMSATPADMAYPQITAPLIAQTAEKYLTGPFKADKALDGNLIVELYAEPASALDIAKVLDNIYSLPEPITVDVIPEEALQSVFEQSMDPVEAANWVAVIKSANRGEMQSIADAEGNYPPGAMLEVVPFDLKKEIQALL